MVFSRTNSMITIYYHLPQRDPFFPNMPAPFNHECFAIISDTFHSKAVIKNIFLCKKWMLNNSWNVNCCGPACAGCVICVMKSSWECEAADLYCVCLMMMNPDGRKRVTCLSECINNLFESICRRTNLPRSSNRRQITRNLCRNVWDVFESFDYGERCNTLAGDCIRLLIMNIHMHETRIWKSITAFG